MRTWPTPLQVSQVTGLWPLAAPLPPQVSHSTSLATSISTAWPNTAWLRSSSSSYLQIGAAKHLRAAAAAAAAAEDVAEHLAEHVAEGIRRPESAAPPPWREASMPACPCWS